MNGIIVKVGYKLLGSNDGQCGFVTPLATLHKFNGWTDYFLVTPAQSLEEVYLTLSGKAFGGKCFAPYQDYFSDDPLAGRSDLGDEVNLLFAKKIYDGFSGWHKVCLL